MRNRKEALIRSILLKNYQSYYRLAYSYVHQEADAMDIVQEGAYKAMLKAGSLREERYAGTWVYRIMINTAKDYIKKYERECAVQEEAVMDAKENSMDLDLKEAVDKLPMQEKTLIILRFYEDKPLSEIAEILQENLNTVKSRLYRTLEKLRRELD
ncbi:MAG: sigma-70 family RNA polymerase sigma factor [Lachnospiraceae bacterium]|nr:sigma-70 family RNA polymerase sigma factor [Lachnospiraceae bacterium]